ncbi:MAG: hypothetical protein AAB699_00060 [Patescibacteria group bacterium]
MQRISRAISPNNSAEGGLERASIIAIIITLLAGGEFARVRF